MMIVMEIKNFFLWLWKSLTEPSKPKLPSGFYGVTRINHLGKEYWVTNDYFRLNGILQPVTGLQASYILEENPGWELPTCALVDTIWNNAVVQLIPKPFRWDPANITQKGFNEHNDVVQRQMEAAGVKSKDLVAGHKKDIVAGAKEGRVAIYGWHHLNGRPIQPLSNIHGETYVDYSHGLRLVKPVEG